MANTECAIRLKEPIGEACLVDNHIFDVAVGIHLVGAEEHVFSRIVSLRRLVGRCTCTLHVEKGEKGWYAKNKVLRNCKLALNQMRTSDHTPPSVQIDHPRSNCIKLGQCVTMCAINM